MLFRSRFQTLVVEAAQMSASNDAAGAKRLIVTLDEEIAKAGNPGMRKRYESLKAEVAKRFSAAAEDSSSGSGEAGK